MTEKPTTKELMLTYMPTFCWQTAYEILTQLEEVYEDVDYRTILTMLCYLVKQGSVLRAEAYPNRNARFKYRRA